MISSMNWIMSVFGIPLGYIMWACYQLISNYGVCIILFTLITRLLLMPFSIKQQKNSARMAVMRPKMEALAKQYGDDKQKYQEELMALYSREKYNPMSGCLPMLIQFPILFGLIDVVYKPLRHLMHMSADAIEQMTETAKVVLGGEISAYSPQISAIQAFHQAPEQFSFLEPEMITQLQNFDFNFLGMDLGQIPTLGWNLLIIIPILSGITNLVYSIYSQKMQEKISPQNAQTGGMMKGVMLMMPLFSVFFAFQVPAGVGFYWLVSNIMMFIQGVVLNVVINPEKFLAEAKAKEEAEKLLAEEDRKRRRLEAAEQQRERQAEGKNKKKEKEKPKKEKDPGELTEKEKNRRKLAEARRRDAEKYGEEFVDVTDEDLD